MRRIRFPIVSPYIPRKGIAEVVKVLKSGWLTQGEYVARLEEKISKYNKVKYAFLLNSATSGLIAALQALGLKAKDEVIVPSFTFPATSNAVILAGAKPVFCDIELDTFNISPVYLKRLINRRTKAIIPVHEFGLSAQMSDIVAIAREYGLFVIEDAACSLGADYHGKKSGTFGDVGIFSFHPRKMITSGEGGCIVTNSSRIAYKIETLRNHGEHNKKFTNCGYNFRLSDIQAAVLLFQFERIEQLIARRIKLAQNYNALLSPLEARGILKSPSCPQGFRHTYQSYVIRLSDRLNRDKLQSILRNKGIETQFGTYCVPAVEFYRDNFHTPRKSYLNAYYAYKHTLTLPLYHTLEVKEQKFIVAELTRTVKKCAA